MKTKFMVVLFLLSFGVCNAFVQKNNEKDINKFNKLGQKEGYWTEDRGFDVAELYYRNGKKWGLFKCYYKTGILSSFGEYTDNEISGTWYYFGDKGQLTEIRKSFAKNTASVLLDSGKMFVYPHKCYYTAFYPNGEIREEGVLLWDEDPELDTVREFGEWKYYDQSGKLIKIQTFK